MRNKYSIYLFDHVNNLFTFGSCISLLFLIPILALLIIDLINNYNVYDLSLTIKLGAVIFLVIFLLLKARTSENLIIEKIIVTATELIIILYKNHRKQKIIFKKSDIKKFHIEFDARIFFRSINYYMIFNIETFSNQESQQLLFSFQTKGIIKSIFKIARYIPNFSYSIDNECIPVIADSIKNIAIYGKDFSIIEFLKYILTNPNVSNAAKLQTYFWLTILPILLFSILHLLLT